MPLWSRRERKSPHAITASGRRVDLADRETVTTLSMTRMAWQPVAWNYRNSIPELGQALRMKAQIISKVRFVPAVLGDTDDDPTILTGDPKKDVDEDKKPLAEPHVVEAAIDAVSRLPFGDGYKFTGRIIQGLDVVGEAWLHGYADADGIEQWAVRSSSEVVVSGVGGFGIQELPGKAARSLDPKKETLIRLWTPHPEYGELSDSPMRTMLDVCEDVVLCGREQRAAALSRIAQNGILKVPIGLMLVRDGSTTVTPQDSNFMASLTVGMTAPINQEGHPGSIVPMVVTGEAEDLQAFEHMPLQRETSAEVLDKQKAGLDRIADSIDMPREAMRGTVGESNHWSAWLIDAQAFRNHLEPATRLMVDSITEGYFRRLLMLPITSGGYGLTRDEAYSVRIWYDATPITANSNRSSDADEAMDRGAISYKAYRAAKSFGEDDAPSEEDLQQLAMFKGTPSQDVMGQLAKIILNTKEPKPQPQIVPGQVVRPGEPATDERQIGPGQAPPNDGTPATKPPGVTAAGAKDSQEVLDSARIFDSTDLAELDKALIERLRQIAETELIAALMKAGSKIKAQAQGKDKKLAAELKGMAPGFVAPTIGPDKVRELGLTEDILLAAAFAILSDQFTRLTFAAVKQAVKAVAGLVNLPLVSVAALTKTMTDRIPAAWKVLEGRLRERAQKALYGRGLDAPQGEIPDTVVLPGMIREALAEIGGPTGDAAPGGIALGGDLLREIDSRADRIGFTWRYGITPRIRTFHPHYELAGKRFAGFDDPALRSTPETAWVGPFLHPGDHDGCMCDAVYSWMEPEADALAEVVAGQESGYMAGERLLAELDDAAGRRGTHSQRTRGERDRMVEVQRAWIERRAPK